MKLFCKILAFLLLAILVGVPGDCFDFEALKEIPRSCSNRGICYRGRGNRLDLSMDWSDVNCFCDATCIDYSDCCLQAKTYDAAIMKENRNKFECVDLFPSGKFYMNGKCEDPDHKLAPLCRRARPESLIRTIRSDPFLDSPVTSVDTGVTYKNVYCAACNGEPLDVIKIWPAQIHCPKTKPDEEPFVKENLQFFNGSWGIFTLGDEFRECDIFPSVADTVLHKVRRCLPHVDSCSVNWTDSVTEDLCKSYTTIVYGRLPANLSEADVKRILNTSESSTDLVAFKNYHCALCNGVIELDTLLCNLRDVRTVIAALNPLSLSAIFDFGEKINLCKVGQMWDPFSKKCRQIICLDESTSPECLLNETKIHSNFTVTNVSTLNDERCDRVFYNESEYYMENATVVVYKLRQSFSENQFQLLDDGVVVCLPSQDSKLMGWLTLIGLGLSCVCLVLHLGVFLIVPDLKNLSGRNLASLCVALLTAFLCFIVSTLAPSGDCRVLASVMYYSFVASFAWMNVMAFDIWKTLQMATTELRVTTGKQRKKFLIYCLYAWLLPALAISIILYIDIQQPSWIPPNLFPELGEQQCWFGQKNSLLVYFVIPVGIIMLCNVSFFAHSVFMVVKTTQSSRVSQPDRIQLKLYLRLALLMGLSWITGVVGGYLQNDYLNYIFILLNAFQGLFIFLGFTCTSKVRKALFKSQLSQTDSSKLGLASNDSNKTNSSTFSSKSSLPSP